MSGRRFRAPLLVAIPLVGLAALVLVVGPPGAVRAAPPEAPADAGVQVDGVGTATGTPDVLRVTVGVESTAETVGEALRTADAAARRVLDRLRDEDVPERDVQTSNVALHPAYADEERGITGYTARHDLRITLRDVQTAGETIGAVVDAGRNAARVEGLSYGIEDDAALQQEAREQAFAAARQKAEQYAALAGRELGDVVEIREQLAPSGPMPYAAEDAGGAAGMALAPGTATVTVTAQVRWSLR